MEHYDIVSDNLPIEDVIGQVNAIETLPCVIKIYDRVFTIDTKDELFVLVNGLEVGFFLAQEAHDIEVGRKAYVSSLTDK